MTVQEIPVQELKRRQDAGEAVRLIDVREPWEFALASVHGAVNIPLSELAQRLQELDPKAETVVMCKVGGRSSRAAAFLQTRGFERVLNLAGGIDAWTRDIDPSLQSY